MRGQYQYPFLGDAVLQQAGRKFLHSPEGQATMEQAAAEYIKTGLPADDLPDFTVIFENHLI
jgi:hypothetical protein